MDVIRTEEGRARHARRRRREGGAGEVLQALEAQAAHDEVDILVIGVWQQRSGLVPARKKTRKRGTVVGAGGALTLLEIGVPLPGVQSLPAIWWNQSHQQRWGQQNWQRRGDTTHASRRARPARTPSRAGRRARAYCLAPCAAHTALRAVVRIFVSRARAIAAARRQNAAHRGVSALLVEVELEQLRLEFLQSARECNHPLEAVLLACGRLQVSDRPRRACESRPGTRTCSPRLRGVARQCRFRRAHERRVNTMKRRTRRMLFRQLQKLSLELRPLKGLLLNVLRRAGKVVQPVEQRPRHGAVELGGGRQAGTTSERGHRRWTSADAPGRSSRTCRSSSLS